MLPPLDVGVAAPPGLLPKRNGDEAPPLSAGLESPPKPNEVAGALGVDVAPKLNVAGVEPPAVGLDPKVKDDGAEVVAAVLLPKAKDPGAEAVPVELVSVCEKGLVDPPAVKLNVEPGAVNDCDAG